MASASHQIMSGIGTRGRLLCQSNSLSVLRVGHRLTSSNRVAASASDEQNASSTEGSEEKVPSEQARRINRPPPLPVQGMKLERVERLDKDAWAGVANVDRGETGVRWKDAAILAGGDVAALMIFATIGRVSHGEALSVMDSFGTALPFIIGWAGSSTLLGGYGASALRTPLKTAASAWVTGIPAGLLVRSVARGYFPETTFVMISMAVTGVFLIGWRSAYAKWIADPLESTLSAKEQLKQRQNKRGNPFEFISLLVSLVKRW